MNRPVILGLCFLALAGCGKGTAALTVTSPAFPDGGAIPAKYTCDGADVSPPISISDLPDDATGIGLLLRDPDAPHGSFLHWAVWNVNAGNHVWPEGAVPDGAFQGTNDANVVGYTGPCPPSGTHHYIFDVYALAGSYSLWRGAARASIEAVFEKQAIARGRLTGVYARVQ